MAEKSEHSNSDSPKQSGRSLSFSSEHSPMAEVEAASQSTYMKDRGEKWNEYAQTEIANYVIMQLKGTGGRGKGKLIAGSAKVVDRQGVEDIVEGARETAEPRECQQGEKKKRLRGF